MAATVSPGTGRRYGRQRVCRVYRVARSTSYAARYRTVTEAPEKRGPKTIVSDDGVLAAIRQVLAESPFHGEGHKKVHYYVRHRLGVVVGRNRVLRLMREHNLLAPHRSGRAHGPKAHDGTIRAARPDVMWGTDGTRFRTVDQGWCWFFVAIDHCVGDVVGWHVAKTGDRFAALEPVQQGLEQHVGATDQQGIGAGLALRHDWGTQYTSHHVVESLAYWAITDSPSFVGEPQGNGIAERFMRTLKEQCLRRHTFTTLAEARETIRKFIETYNNQWVLQRLNYQTPAQARKAFDSQPTQEQTQEQAA